MNAKEYRVKGKGRFPWDMIRYVPSIPRTEDDEYSMLATEQDYKDSFDQEREIELIAIGAGPTVNFLAEKRWESFGWKVVEYRPRYYVKFIVDEKRMQATHNRLIAEGKAAGSIENH